MKKYLFSLMMMAMGSALVTSCLSNDDDNKRKDPEVVTITSGVYVVNNGTWNHNNGSLSYFDYGTLQTSQLLEGVSGLGDTPNDAFTKGDTIFIVGSTENTIFVVNKKNFNIIKRISTTETMGEAEGYNPRHITGLGNNIYFTTYGGYVGVIDAKSLTMSQTKYKVGSGPEGLAVGGSASNPFLYVANSDYAYGNGSISKIDLSSGDVEEIKNEMIKNPQEIIAIGNDLYILDWGYYDESWSHQIDPGLYLYKDGNVNKLIADATGMGAGLLYYNNEIIGYLIVTFNNPYGSTSKPTYSTFNTYSGERKTLTLSGEPSGYEIFSPAAIAVDPLRGNIIIASRPIDPETGYASYTLPGYANMYTSDGVYIKDTHFQTGIEPHMIGFTFDKQIINY